MAIRFVDVGPAAAAPAATPPDRPAAPRAEVEGEAAVPSAPAEEVPRRGRRAPAEAAPPPEEDPPAAGSEEDAAALLPGIPPPAKPVRRRRRRHIAFG